MFKYKLRNFTPCTKLFVGMTTILMLGVVLWSMFIYYVDKSLLGEHDTPLYMQTEIDDTKTETTETNEGWEEQLRRNIGLAHTHINGQTLLYFVLGLFLVLTGVKPKLKRILTVVFGATIFTHTIGLTGEGFHWVFDDLLAVSGVGLLVLIPYISFLVLMELFQKPDADLSI